MNDEPSEVTAAKAQIASILADLERKTGQLVDDISLLEIDVTCVEDDKRRIQMAIEINLVRLPGHQW